MEQYSLALIASNANSPPPPPRRTDSNASNPDNPAHPLHYTRDLCRLVGYLVPFPRPTVGIHADAVPSRFLIYTLPPRPLRAPGGGEKESSVRKVQRGWQDKVRAAKRSDAKMTSWRGIKSKATRGISTAMSMTKSSNLVFVNRIGGLSDLKLKTDANLEDNEPHKTVALEKMTLVYPQSLALDQAQLRREFIDSMMRTKSKAQRDTIIATGLLPVSACIDILASLVWPFGGLLECDAIWLYASARGAMISRSVIKRLTPSSSTDHVQDKLRLEFLPSERIDVLSRYLASKCHDKDHEIFPSAGVQPTETDVLRAMGWAPSQTGDQNWEDEQWETTEVKDDVRTIMTKGAKEWDKWVRLYTKDPDRACKK